MVLSFLFAMAFASSFAVMEVTSEVQIDADVLNIIRIGTAVGLGLSLLLLLFTFKRGRRAKGETAGNDGTEERPPAEKHVQTYEEVFGVQHDLDEGGLPHAPEGEESLSEEWQKAEEVMVDGDGLPSEQQEPAEVPASTSEDDLQPVQADVDGSVEKPQSDDQVESGDADVDSDQHLRKIREEFKARVEEAALRVKQREGDPHEAASAPNPER
ncbi:MAG TPA: hypothetical protein VFA08_13690 [Actinomycetota bacterium]|nr:hypothetical protein [Actinomycetota bacterium]